jgi:thiol-disulfide isomerase/thioredoxin
MMIGMGLIGVAIMFLLLKTQPAAATTASSSDFSAVPVKVDLASPKLDLATLDGVPASLADYRGKVVLVNLWATWCPPCREEMPTLEKFYQKYKANGFELIAVNQEETKDVVEPFVKEFGLSFPVWLDPDYLAQREFNTANLPSSYVIDRNGRVRLSWIGRISETRLEEYVPEIIME